MATYKKIVKGFAKVNFPDDMPEECAAFILGLCQRKPEERLTMGSLGVQNLRDHSWFEGFAWRDLQEQQMLPPWQPDVKEADLLKTARSTEVEPFGNEPDEDDGTNWDAVFCD